MEKVQVGGDIAVVMIGYEAPMMEMLDNANPGLKSRFDPASALRFEDYTDAELTQILTRQARGYKVRMYVRTIVRTYVARRGVRLLLLLVVVAGW